MTAPSSLTRPHVLVVEDEIDLREVIGAAISDAGYDITLAASPNEALALLETSTFDLILTDLFATQPRDQLGSIARLRACAQPIPIGIMTAWKLPGQAAEQQGFAWVVQKPFEIDDLLHAIAQSLNPLFSPEQAQQAQTIERFLAALSNGEWDVLQVLCSPTVCYYPPSAGASAPLRVIRGLDVYLNYAQKAHTHYPDYHIDHCVMFLYKQQLVTRFTGSWHGAAGERLRIAGSVMCRFAGQRLTKIAVFLNRHRLQYLLATTRAEGQSR